MSAKRAKIAVAHGDGIGPEIMEATLKILDGAKAPLDFSTVEIGEKVYLKGHQGGIEPGSWDIIRGADAFLKAPITTPQGGGFKSLNVTVRTTLGLFANIRPCVAYSPFINTKHPDMDVVIIRENEEDLYSGIEYRQSATVCESLKIISREGTEKICRYAFEYAVQNGRKKVTCFTKDNIMKLSDGLFTQVFLEVAKDYPSIENEHWIVDIGAAKLADTPQNFDVVVLPNLYGDILSDVAAQIAGSVGLAGSANIGIHGAMFEAIHGSAPRRANQNLANPSGLILASILMLNHVGLGAYATNIHNAWLSTIEQGFHTYDIFKEGISKEKVGTQEFADKIISNLGQRPQKLKAVDYPESGEEKTENNYLKSSYTPPEKTLVGADIFVSETTTAKSLQEKLLPLSHPDLELVLITNRGVKVWPDGLDETFCIDQWRCRYRHKDPELTFSHEHISQQLEILARHDIDFIKTENLYDFGEEKGYSSNEF
ncbi:MAG: NADP-dependent isocitrate dehydrogenase [Chlamydiales bacterium]|nr:NADP-dependent isocitrate dehydrogenase [Chlamydiales bacterium]